MVSLPKSKLKVHSVFRHPVAKNCLTAKVVEDSYQIMSIIDNNQVQIILCYLSSNCKFAEVARQLQKIIRSDNMTVVCGDFKYDKAEVNPVSKFLKSQNFQQIVTKPTHDEGRTLDHCYVSKSLSEKVQLTFYSLYYSDNDALCISLRL